MRPEAEPDDQIAGPPGSRAVPDDPRRTVLAGRVGRPHGLDGSFHVVDPAPILLQDGGRVIVDGRELLIVRRAGDDRRPLLRLEGVEDRAGAEELRGHELLVDRERAPELPADEWWPDQLEGCAVRDGERSVGTVRRVLPLPSCEVLEIARLGEPDLLVPLIRDAVRAVDVDRREIEIDLRFLGES